MNSPARNILAKLRRTPTEPLPEPELAPERLVALRFRAAAAEDPDLLNFNADSNGEESTQGGALQPVVLVRKAREADTVWTDATSWFGGLPKLGAIEWPRDSDGYPLPFAGQIGVADIAAVRPNSLLPSTGSLAFFLGEGAVIYVPAGVTQFTQAPDDLAPSFDEGGFPFPAEESPFNRLLFPFWPVEPVALILPANLRDPSDTERHEEIYEAMDAALPTELARREIHFSAASLPEDAWDGPMPIWWHGVDHLLGHLRLALAHASGGQQDGLAALIGALEGFAAERDPWEPLSPEENEVFVEALDNAWQQFDGVLHHPAPRDVKDLATLSLRAMISGEAEAFAALPVPARDALNRDYRMPIGALPQMFGLGADIQNAVLEHIDDVLLLQLPYDDMMEWRFGDNGAFQFWISPADLAERRFDVATLTFDGH
jgi:hypothetical protein